MSCKALLQFTAALLVTFFLVQGLLPWQPLAVAAIDSNDERFQRAYDAARSGRTTTLARLKPLLIDHPLYPYVVYADLRRRLSRADDGEVLAFLDRYQDTPLARQMREAWLLRLGQAGRWQALLDHDSGGGGVELRCLRARARLEVDDREGLLGEISNLWLAGQSQPDACDVPFDWFKRQGGVSANLAWQRIQLAHAAGERRLAGYLTRYLPAAERRWEARLRAMLSNPARELANARHWPANDYAREVAMLGLHRLAPQNPEQARERLLDLAEPLALSEEQRGRSLRRIALMAATDYHERAADWLRELPADQRDAQIRQWQVRVALRARDWQGVIDHVQALDAKDQADVRWRYWRARALDALGHNDQAFLLFEQIAREPNYHGFLASDYLRLPYSLCPLELDLEGANRSAVASDPALQRALLLYRLEMLVEARREWQWGLRNRPAQERREAALLAHQAGWHGRAILTLADTGDWRLYDVRFPTEHRSLVSREARRNGLNPAWVFGIMRAESAFVEDARSSANARGLMQLTPGTGREVARRNGLPLANSGELYRAERNIPLGAAHLRELLDDFDGNPVLATAAYNAGPTPVNRWLDEHPGGSADLWVETMPYGETRSYVGSVMAFAAVYDWRLDDKIKPLSRKMPSIGGSAPSDGREVTVVCRAE